MTDHQEDKLSMYITVQKICNAKKSIWSELPAFVDIFGKFENIISDIYTQHQIQKKNITGITENKHKEEIEMMAITLDIAAAVYAYAASVGDDELRDSVNYSPSNLRNARDTVLKDICQSIHDAANGVVTELDDYGVTPEILEKQQKEIDDFVEILAKPRTAINKRATATAYLKELFKQADNLLKHQLDKLMITYRIREPEFYNNYRYARRIVDTGSRSKKEEGDSKEPENEI